MAERGSVPAAAGGNARRRFELHPGIVGNAGVLRLGQPRSGKKRRRAAALQDAGAFHDDSQTARSVLDCASPLALFWKGGRDARGDAKLFYLFDHEFWLCIKRRMHIGNNGESNRCRLDITHVQNASSLSHEVSF